MLRKKLDISEIANQFSLGTIPAYKLVAIAEELIQDGQESPSLIGILIEDSPYSEDRIKLFAKALSELGYPVPSKQVATRIMARKIAKQIVAGKISPYEGSMKIWKEVLDFIEPIPDELWPFKSNASLIEDCIVDKEIDGSDHADLIANATKEIMECSRELIITA